MNFLIEFSLSECQTFFYNSRKDINFFKNLLELSVHFIK